MKLPLVLAEGGAQSPIWRQIVCDCLRVQGVYLADSKGAPEGDAVIAGVGTGVFKDYDVVKNWVSVSDQTEPIEENAKIYDELYKIYRNIYEEIKDNFLPMAELVRKMDK